MLDHLLSAVQYPLPHHALSRLMFRLLRIRTPWLKDLQIRTIAKLYGVDVSEAAAPVPSGYATFNEFFVRTLKEGARPIASGPGEVACPVDGAVSQAGRIEDGRIFQAKGRSYTVEELLASDASPGENRASPFRDGSFATLYLSPKDYHRVHMPLAGELREMVHVPGRLFSVNPGTTRTVPKLFARNERVVCLFETAVGPMAVVLVGAIFVAAMETVWAGLVTPPAGRRVTVRRYGPGSDMEVSLGHGEEMGRFNMGSTVIVLFGAGAVEWAEGIVPGAGVRMGEVLGRTR
jgi:phosphatidylserine decarboxylase